MSENAKPTAENSSTDEIDLLDVLIVLARQKKWIAGLTVGIGGAALVTSLLMTPIFTATAKIMPPQQQSGQAAMMGQLGVLAGAAGGIAGLKNPNDLYVGMLQSQTVADNLIQGLKLKERFETPSLVDTRMRLESLSTITAGKDGLISITIDDKDPKFAAELANAYVEELIKLTQTLAVTDAAQQRLFYEKQLQATKDKLGQAEVALKQTQEKTGMLQPDGQVPAIIANVAQLKAAIAAKEVEMAAMRSFATEQNPDYIRTQQEIQGLKTQLTKLEQGQPEAGDFMIPTGKVPQTGLEYIRKLRDVKYYETMFELLAKQYELAKINEAKDSSTIQVLDKAIPADKRSKPKRALITLVGLIMGFFVGILGAFIREAYEKSRESDTHERWQTLSRALKQRS